MADHDPSVEAERTTGEETRAIVRRRFGRGQGKRCADPTVIACTMWACQVRDRCRLIPKARHSP